MNILEQLIAAKELLLKEGWCKSHFHFKGRRCLVAALNDTHRDNYKTRKLLTDIIGCTSLILWQDEENITQEDIMKILDVAIELSKPKFDTIY